MQSQQRIFTLSTHGSYAQGTRSANHPSIVLANQRMNRLSFTKCNQIYKGESYFKDSETEQFYLRNRSTPAKSYMTQSKSSSVSTYIEDSNHKNRGNSLEQSKNSIKVIKPQYDGAKSTLSQYRKQSVNAFARYQFQQAKRFQLPENFPRNNLCNSQESNNVSINNPFKVQLLGLNKMLKNAFIENQVDPNGQSTVQKTPRKANEQTIIKYKQTPKTTESLINSSNQRTFRDKEIDLPSSITSISSNLQLNSPFKTPISQLNVSNCKQNSQRASLIANKNNIVRKIIYSPNQKKLPEPKIMAKSSIKYDDYCGLKTNTVKMASNGSQIIRIQSKSNFIIPQNPENKFIKLDKNIKNVQTQRNPSLSAKEINVNKQKQEKDQLTLLRQQLLKCKRQLKQSQNREKILLSELNRSKNLEQKKILENKTETPSFKADKNLMINRDWGRELNSELSRTVTGQSSEYFSLYMFVIFLIMLSKQTINS